MTKIMTLAAGLLVATSATAFASVIDDRQEAQGRKIEIGRETGAITWREGLMLQKEQREIARLEAEFLGDGKLSKPEKRTLNEMLDEAAQHIAFESSDRWHRLWFMPRFGK
jgi:hypothetical protein